MSTTKNRTSKFIDINDVTDLSILKERVIYHDTFIMLDKDRQQAVYDYLRMHSEFPACQENLKKVRYALSMIYFGY